MRIIDDHFMVCVDCLFSIVNDDYTNEDHINAMVQGYERLHPLDFVTLGDNTKDEEFSKKPCELCNTKLYGSRYHMVLMRKKPCRIDPV